MLTIWSLWNLFIYLPVHVPFKVLTSAVIWFFSRRFVTADLLVWRRARDLL